MEDFEEIAHSGGKIIIEVKDNSYSFGLKHCRPTAHAASGLTIHTNIGPVQAFIISDQEGLFGRKCPKCNDYFRMEHIREYLFCPYCGFYDLSVNYKTENQKKYLDAYLEAFFKAIKEGKTTEIDFDSIIDGLADNKHGFIYSEERQQKRIECLECKTVYDILGEYGFCPNCRKRNTLEALEYRLNHLLERVNSPIFSENERDKRDREWEEVLKSAVSEFEALGNDLLEQLLKLPMHPKRKKEVERISFQNIKTANEKMERCFGFSFIDGFKEADISFIIKCFNKRHLFTHKSGMVDDEIGRAHV